MLEMTARLVAVLRVVCVSETAPVCTSPYLWIQTNSGYFGCISDNERANKTSNMHLIVPRLKCFSCCGLSLFSYQSPLQIERSPQNASEYLNTHKYVKEKTIKAPRDN